MPARGASSGVALNAAKDVPSAAVRRRSSCETAAPAITGIGGVESRSKHIAPKLPERKLCAEAGAAAGRALDVEPAVQRDDTVEEAAETGAAIQLGAAAAVVLDDDHDVVDGLTDAHRGTRGVG